MAEIRWAVLNTITSYCVYGQFLLLKRTLKGYFVYSVWQNNEMVYICYNEFQFVRLVSALTVVTSPFIHEISRHQETPDLATATPKQEMVKIAGF